MLFTGKLTRVFVCAFTDPALQECVVTIVQQCFKKLFKQDKIYLLMLMPFNGHIDVFMFYASFTQVCNYVCILNGCHLHERIHFGQFLKQILAL